jgi:hypothetical protein
MASHQAAAARHGHACAALTVFLRMVVDAPG